MKTLNNNLLVRAYKGENKIKSKVSSGFATVQQKSTLVPLEAVESFEIEGTEFKAGAMVFFKEEDLFTHAWSKTTFTSEAIEGEFVIADKRFVVGVK